MNLYFNIAYIDKMKYIIINRIDYQHALVYICISELTTCTIPPSCDKNIDKFSQPSIPWVYLLKPTGLGFTV